MTTGRTSNAAAIEARDAQVRSLYRRLRVSGPDHHELAGAVRALHAILKDLRIEARSLISHLNAASPAFSAVSSRDLVQLLGECDFTLQQLTAIADSPAAHPFYRSAPNTVAAGSVPGGAALPGPIGAADEIETRQHIALVHSKVQDNALKLNQLLVSISAHSPTGIIPELPDVALANLQMSPSISPIPPDDQGLDTLKSSVESIARRLSHQGLVSASQFAATSFEELWQVFYTELAYEGFSNDALSTHQVILQTQLSVVVVFFVFVSFFSHGS